MQDGRLWIAPGLPAGNVSRPFAADGRDADVHTIDPDPSHAPDDKPFETCRVPMQVSPDILKRCWFLAGPTASGKTRAGLLLAEALNAEIISLDSMALYRGMDIGTAKPTPAEQAAVPHHLIDIIDPHEEYTVAEYVTGAKSACEEILGRGRTPLFVGGTGLYLRSLLRGVFDGPPADWEYRSRLETEAAESGPEVLFERLRSVDPASAQRLHPNDVRRVIRALEVHHVTGRPLSEQQRQPPLPADQRPRHVFWLNPDRGWLHERINERVTAMFAAGLVEEVRGLLDAEQPISRTARQALGYKEILDAIAAEQSFDSAADCIRVRTRQFAKRQCTWFRNLEECEAVPIGREATAETIAEAVLQR